MDEPEDIPIEKGVVVPSMRHQSLRAVSAISIDVVRACGVRGQLRRQINEASQARN